MLNRTESAQLGNLLRRIAEPLVGELDDLLWRWLVYTFVAAVLGLVVRLVWITLSAGTSFRTRRQAGVFLLGMGVTLIPIGIWIGSAFGPSANGFFLGQLDVRYLFLGAPLTLAFVILRYRTFRSMHPLFRAVVALASSALLAVLRPSRFCRSAKGATVAGLLRTSTR